MIKKIAMMVVLGSSLGHVSLEAKTVEKYDSSVMVVNAPSMSIGDLGFRVICALGGIVTLKATLALGSTALISGTGAVVCTVGTVIDSSLLVPAVLLGGCSLATGGVAYYTGGWTCRLFRAAIERNDVVVIKQFERD